MLGPTECVSEGRAVWVEETRRIDVPESEAKLGFVQDKEAARRNHRPGWDDVLCMPVVAVQEFVAGEIDRGRATVEDLDPIAGCPAAGFDLVDLHGTGDARP